MASLPVEASRRRHASTASVASVVGAIGAVMVVVVVGIVSIPHGQREPTTTGAVVRHVGGRQGKDVVKTTTDSGPPFAALLPTAASPLRVLEIGDSLGIDLGDQLQSQLDATGLATTTVAAMGDTGLVNLAYYDWPAQLVALLAADHPQLVVVFLGANDDQGLDVDGMAAAPGTAPWTAAYAQRVDAVVRETTATGARVVWVGMPPMANPDLNAAMAVEDAIFQHETDAFAGTLYVASAPVLGDASGQYETSGTDGSGQQVVLRTPDGVHLTPDGAGELATAVIDAIDSRWHLTLGSPTPPDGTMVGTG
jgi:hypothetical protein